MFLPHCSICSVKQDSHINFRRRVQLKDSRKRSVPRKINITIEIQINTVNQVLSARIYEKFWATARIQKACLPHITYDDSEFSFLIHSSTTLPSPLCVCVRV